MRNKRRMQITFINIEDANIIQWITTSMNNTTTTSSSYYPQLTEGATIMRQYQWILIPTKQKLQNAAKTTNATSIEEWKMESLETNSSSNSIGVNVENYFQIKILLI